MTPPETGRAEPRSVLAHRAIRSLILSGEIAPGAPMVESDLAERFGFSRTPVRESLMRLEIEGLVRTSPGRRLFSATLTIKEATDLFHMREAMEGMAARLAALHADEALIRTLDSLLRDEAAVPVSDPDRLLEINDAFHQAIYDASGNQYIQNAMERFRTGMAILRNMTRKDFVPMPEAPAFHRAIFDAIEAQDPVRAEDAARRHIRASRRKRLALLEKRLSEV